MVNIVDIIDGNVKNLLNINEDLSDSRMKICYSCPLFSNKLGGICNNKLWLDPITGDVSVSRKDGYVKGCGCVLRSKTRLPHAKCPAEKW